MTKCQCYLARVASRDTLLCTRRPSSQTRVTSWKLQLVYPLFFYTFLKVQQKKCTVHLKNILTDQVILQRCNCSYPKHCASWLSSYTPPAEIDFSIPTNCLHLVYLACMFRLVWLFITTAMMLLLNMFLLTSSCSSSCSCSIFVISFCFNFSKKKGIQVGFFQNLTLH